MNTPMTKIIEAEHYEIKRLRAALALIWHLHTRKEVHLGYDRLLGLRRGCIPCVCALALDQGMSGSATLEQFEEALSTLKPKGHVV